MEKLNSQSKNSGTVFGRLLAQKRGKAGLSLSDLAGLAGLSLGCLEELERGETVPNFDLCYKIGQAINSRHRQGFIVQDLWEAASLDKLSLMSRELDNKSLQADDPSNKIGALSTPVGPRAA
ncbi:MAG TPA: helix-turn-helix transcriptional regulator [Blastocatellia bacterium]|nr:helix-turn-helix transcriptional regulator [Blastocatellia bacterium]